MRGNVALRWAVVDVVDDRPSMSLICHALLIFGQMLHAQLPKQTTQCRAKTINQALSATPLLIPLTRKALYLLFIITNSQRLHKFKRDIVETERRSNVNQAGNRLVGGSSNTVAWV